VLGPVVVDRDGGVDPAGGRDGMRAHRVDLAHDRDRGTGLGGGESGPLPGKPGADDEDVMGWHVRDSTLGDPLRQDGRQGAPHLLDRHDAAQHAVGVDGHERPVVA